MSPFNSRRTWLDYWKSWRIRAIVLVAALCVGCGDNRPETARVHGTITVDGKPAGPARIRFVPSAGRFATGEVKPDGTYTLSTYGDGDGALIGTHRVAIEPLWTRGPSFESDPQPVKSGIPERYGLESRSGLTYDVKPGQENEANFELSSR